MPHPPRRLLTALSARPAFLGQARSASRSILRPLLAVLASGSLMLAPAHAQLPVGATVVNGSATIATSGARMTVTNSPSTILNWQAFSIGAPNGVHFQQQNATSQVLNRVTGKDPSQILGSLSSNGRVWLINPRGILFGQNARIDVAGLVASTLDIANADFLANRYNFVSTGTDKAEVLNQGEIRTSFGGRVWLLGEQVRNEGLIDSPGGNIVLAAGKSIELIDSGLPNVIVRVSAPENQTVNLGTLVASGGSIDLHGGIVNQEGIVRADSVGTDAFGRLVLRASDAVTLSETSQTTAQGGSVHLEADTVNNRGKIGGQEVSVAADQILQQGEIKAPGGRITLTAGSTTYLDGRVDVSDPLGSGGSIWLTTGKLEGMAGGSLRADGRQGGSIHVEGRGMVAFSSTFSATGTERGGRIEVTGDRVYLLNADVDASGARQGGTVHLGGDWQGKGDLPHAREVVVGVGSEVRANGTPAGPKSPGQGGEVVVWSTESSEHYGSLQAKDGGRIELSSKGEIRQTGDLQTGPGGSVLFDPKNLVITDSPPDSLTMARKVVSGSVTSQPALGDGDQFGFAMALDGDRLAVTAQNFGTGGSVHLFTGVGTDFSELTWQKKLSSGTGAVGMPVLDGGTNLFGSSVALDGDRLAVGQTLDSTGGTFRGAVHLFTGVGTDFSGLTWRRKLASGSGAISMPALADGDQFGGAVALDGDRLAVGARFDATGGVERGAVHLFTGVGTDFSGLTWQKKLASGTGAIGMPTLGGSNFGSAVALDGDRMAVGTPYETRAGFNTGAVYLFTGVGTDFSGLSWQKKLASATGATGMPALADGDQFGRAIALDGEHMAVTATLDNYLDGFGRNRGAVHLFTGVGADFSGLSWQKKLESSSGAVGMPGLVDRDRFGYSLAIQGDRLAVGAYGDDTGGSDRGAVHLFTGVGTDFSGLTWQKKLASGTGTTGMPALSDADSFGEAVALNGDRLVVGAPRDSTGGIRRGAVHLFNGISADIAGLTWQKKLASGTGSIAMPVLANNDLFGSSVALDGDRLAVGAGLDDSGGIDRGAVHLFTGVGVDFSGLNWQKKLSSGTGAIGMPALADLDRFGSVALDGDRLAVGASGDSSGRGAVHLFTGVGTNFSGLTWQRRVASSSGAAGMPALTDTDGFGGAIALDGDRLAVGAYQDDTGGVDINSNRGAVHLFTGVGTDFSGLTWRKKLASSTGAVAMPSLADLDNFGFAVALDGNRLAVGARFDSTGGVDRGAVHLFTGVGADFSGLTWQKKLASGTGAIAMPVLANADEFGSSVALDGDRLAVGARLDDSGGTNRGAVFLFTGLTSSDIGVGDATFATTPAGTSYLRPASITSLLGAGTAVVTLQANNDITVLSDVAIAGAGPGALILQAGRNIDFRANVLIDIGRNLVAVAGDPAANPAFRDPGTPTLTIASGVVLSAANVTFAAVGGNVINNAGDTGIDSRSPWLIYAANPATTIEGFSTYNKHYDQPFIAGSTPTYVTAGNWFLYSAAPTLAVSPGSRAITYGDATPTVFSPSFTGFIDDDSAVTAGLSGTATWSVAGPASSSGNRVAGPHDVSLTGGLASSLGYRFADNATSTDELTVSTKLLTAAYTASPKTYDGSIGATVGGSSPDLIAGDSVGFSQSAAFLDRHVGSAKLINVTGIALGGPDALNYALASTTASTTADITPATVSVVYAASPKTYDSTTAATVSASSPGIFAADTVSFSVSAAFRDKNVGLAKPIDVGVALGGAHALNYVLASATGSTSADITARALTAAYSASPKTYDGTTTATVSGSSPDLVAGDSVSFSQSAAFRDKNVGLAKPIDVTAIALGGPDAVNYVLTSPTASASADITARTLSVAYTASPKVYDGTTATTVSGSSPDLVAGDSVSFSQSAAFRDKNAGLAKPIDVTAIALGGTDALNYALASRTASTSADITARALTVAYSASPKTYDGTTAATVSGRSPDIIAGDSVSFSQSAAFRDKNVGVAKPIDVTAIALGGPDGRNYAPTSVTASTSADIIARALTAVYTASPKTYDGTTAATVSGSSPDLIGGDSVSFSQRAAFRDPDAGVAKSIDVTAIALGGPDAGNYALRNTTALTSADITAPALASTIRVEPTPDDRAVTAAVPDFAVSGDTAVQLALAAVDSDRPLLATAVDESVESVYTAVQLALAVVHRDRGSRVKDLTSVRVPSLEGLNFAQMNRDQMQQVLDSRKEFKKKLFADALYKLEEDPSLAEVRPCQSLADVNSGLCRMTDEQRSELATQAAAKDLARPGARRAKLIKLPQIERKVAVLFGINDYADSAIPRLANAIPDVEMVGQVLATRLGYDVRVVRNPTKADIVRTLNQLSAEVGKSDSVIIYYAGHGYLIEKTGAGYWLPEDASSRTPRRWISNADVSRMLANIGAKQLAVISDSCYSGAFTKEREVGLSGQEIKPQEVLALRSVVVMSSGGDEPVPDGGKSGHSIFAWHLTQTLGQVDNWQGGTTTFENVRGAVLKEFPQTAHYGASVSAGHEAGGDYLFEFRQLEDGR